MERKALYDRIYACWLGKNIGGTLGTPVEGCKEVMHLDWYPRLDPHGALPNDDLDLQLVNLHAMERRASPPSGRNTSTSRGMSTATAEPLCVWDSSRPFPECLTTLSPTAWVPPSAPRYGRRSARESRALRRTLRGRTPWWIMPEAKACSAKYSMPRWKRLPMNPTISLR